MTDQPPRKFRVWDGETMHEPPHNFYLDDSGNVCQYSNAWGGVVGVLDGAVGMMSTGLTDADDTEVWEGDVLEYSLSGNYIQRAKVIYRCASFMLERRDGIYLRLNKVIAGLEYDATVIGNRYEHPELMEEVSTDE